MRHNIYLRQPAEDGLRAIFDYLKWQGEIPANAADIGQYKAVCITFAINYTLGGIEAERKDSAWIDAAARHQRQQAADAGEE